jgi:hypothetical protein
MPSHTVPMASPNWMRTGDPQGRATCGERGERERNNKKKGGHVSEGGSKSEPRKWSQGALPRGAPLPPTFSPHLGQALMHVTGTPHGRHQCGLGGRPVGREGDGSRRGRRRAPARLVGRLDAAVVAARARRAGLGPGVRAGGDVRPARPGAGRRRPDGGPGKGDRQKEAAPAGQGGRGARLGQPVRGQDLVHPQGQGVGEPHLGPAGQAGQGGQVVRQAARQDDGGIGRPHGLARAGEEGGGRGCRAAAAGGGAGGDGWEGGHGGRRGARGGSALVGGRHTRRKHQWREGKNGRTGFSHCMQGVALAFPRPAPHTRGCCCRCCV